MSRMRTGLLIAVLTGGLAVVGNAEAQNVKKEHQTDARVKKCQKLTGVERDACIEQARKRKGLERSLKLTSIPETLFTELMQHAGPEPETILPESEGEGL